MPDEYRLDDLATAAGVPSTTIRLYRSKNLLPPPRLVGRTGWYDESHLSRLRLIARLQAEGHSLAGIADLLEQWERGRSLDAVIGIEASLDALTGGAHAVELDPAELLSRFPDGVMSPDAMQRAAALGLVEPAASGQLRVPDRRFLETGAALAHLGVPIGVVLDEWEALVEHTETIARRFVDVFETYLVPEDWETELDDERAMELAATLGKLQAAADQILIAALDASIAVIARERLSDLVER